MKKTFLIAATSSGSGKTTITIGLLRALKRKGYNIQPFKSGPDYIDIQYHRIACGRDSYNLDLWMNGEEGVRRLVANSDADINIVEGAMGLYDGADGISGSAAHLAETIGAEVILIVNAKSMAHSAAPLLYGYLHWRPETKICAVIFNNVGSKRHETFLRKAAEDVGIECWGCIPRQKELYSPSRYLGLDMFECERILTLSDKMADLVEQNVNLTALTGGDVLTKKISKTCNKSIADNLLPELYVARDEAFNFIYAEAIDLLKTRYDVRFFSPLNNEVIPTTAKAIYLPGGYPELFLDRLAKSTDTMTCLRNTKARIVAECGGMMYLSKAIDKTCMTGLIPYSTTLQNARLHLGYRQMRFEGKTFRGHEFHYSSLVEMPEMDATITNVQGESVNSLFYHRNNITASYIHWSAKSLVKLLTS